LGVWPENRQAVEAFLACQTQWRVLAGFKQVLFIGLDYAGARAALDALAIAITPDLWRDLQIMEAAAAHALNGN
jgi:hypothetical protein